MSQLMEIEPEQKSLPTLDWCNEEIKKVINRAVEKQMMNLIRSIANGEGLSVIHLYKKYGHIFNPESPDMHTPTYYCTPFTPLRWNVEKGEYEDPKDPKNHPRDLKGTRVSL